MELITTMGGLISTVGFFICIVWLLIRLFKRKPKKQPLLTMLLCFVVLSLCMSYDKPPEDISEPQKEKSSAVSNEKESQISKKEKTSSKSEAKESKSKDERQTEKDDFNNSLGDTTPTFYKKVRNDTTENWRMLVCYSSENMKDHIVDYYNAYAESDNEVHFIVNLYLKTTTVINNFGGELYVDVHEYVDKEEHDAKILGGGMLLESYTVNLSSGKISEISSSPDSSSISETVDKSALLKTFMVLLESNLKQNFGENNCTLEYDETAVTINVWADNIALGVVSAIAGNSESIQSWNLMVDSQKTLCDSIVNELKEIGIENYPVMLNVLNELDKTKVLLTVLNGNVIYDAVNG